MQASQEQRLTFAVTIPFGEKHIIWSCIQPFILRKILLSVFSKFTQIEMNTFSVIINKFCNQVFGYIISTRIAAIFTPDCFSEGSFNTKSTHDIHKTLAMTRNTKINNYFFEMLLCSAIQKIHFCTCIEQSNYQI